MLLATSLYASRPAEAPDINTTNINLHFQANFNTGIHYRLVEQFSIVVRLHAIAHIDPPANEWEPGAHR